MLRRIFQQVANQAPEQGRVAPDLDRICARARAIHRRIDARRLLGCETEKIDGRGPIDRGAGMVEAAREQDLFGELVDLGYVVDDFLSHLRVGSIEPGKDADLALFDKHPLSTYDKVEKVNIDGQLYFDREKDIEERPGKEVRKKALTDQEKDREKQERKKPGASEKNGAGKKGDQPGEPQ